MSKLIDFFIYISGGVFTDRDEGIDTQSMESIFKYAIFHYNRLAKNAHNLSFQIRIQEETLSLIAAESAVQTVQDGRRKKIHFLIPPHSFLSLYTCPSTSCPRYFWSTIS
jgi:hypothetical protein